MSNFLLDRSLSRPQVGRFVFFLAIISTGVLSLQDAKSGGLIIPYSSYFLFIIQVVMFGGTLLLLHRVSLRNYGYTLLWLSFFMWSLISGFFSDEPYLVLQRSIRILLPSVMLGVITLADPQPEYTFKIFAKFSAWFGGFLAAIAIIIFAFGSPAMGGKGPILVFNFGPVMISQLALGMSPFLRLGSLVGNPNEFAIWLVFFLIITYSAVHMRILSKRMGFGLFMMQFAGLFLTYSRDGVLTFLVGLVLYLCLLQSVPRQRLVWLVGLIAVLGFAPYLLLTEVLGQTRLAELDLNGREIAWAAFLDSFYIRPLLGVGFGVSYESLHLSQSIGVFHAHNIYLSVLAETGIVGILLFLGIWFHPIVRGLRSLWNNQVSKEHRPILAAAIAILVSCLLHQALEANVLRPYSPFISIVWTYLLFLMLHPSLKENAHKTRRGPARLN